jgi:DNA-binding response OmpR family regulator
MENADTVLLVIGWDLEPSPGLCRRLARCGHAAEAVRFEAGVDRTREARPDLVLCGWASPGEEALRYCEAVKSDGDLRDTRIVLVGSGAASQDRARALDAGADDFLAEPLTDIELAARVRAVLRAVQAQRDSARGAHRSAVLELAAAVGHEINNPLAGLCGHLELIRRHVEREDRPQALHHARRAGDLAGRIAGVVSRLITLESPTTTTYLGAVRMVDLTGGGPGGS